MVPSVSPEESFDCPLGLDPSIRITYHPLSKLRSESGFYTKTTTHVYTQSITVFNAKLMPVEHVRVVEQVPVSEDAQVQVRVLSPPLPNARDREDGKDKGNVQEEGGKKVVVSAEVSAMWDGADEDMGEGEAEVEGEAGVKSGKFCWNFALPAQGKANLVLKYEVGVPAGVNVVGLPRGKKRLFQDID